MIVKVCFGERKFGSYVVECDSLQFVDKEDSTEMVYHGQNFQDGYGVIHLGCREAKDHVYIMDKGETVDHMVYQFQKAKSKGK